MRKEDGKKRKGLRVLACLLLAAGVCVLLFPFASNWVYTWQMDRQIDDYRERVGQYQREEAPQGGSPAASGAPGEAQAGQHPHDLEKLYQEMVAYNQRLFENGQKDLKDPFSYEQPSFDLTQFGFDENMIGYLDISRMGLHLPIYLGASRANMASGVAHLTQTSLPVGGANTNAVIAGHRGMSTKAMFRNIHHLQLGDAVDVTNFRETLHYRVAQIKIIQPDDIQEILIQPGRDLVTLITCNPLGQNYQRYVVYCERAN